METKTYDGKCRGCGEIQVVIANSQREADELVTDACGCEESKHIKEYDMMMANIDEVLGKACTKNGFYPVDSVTIARVRELADLIWRGKIEKASFEIDRTTILISNTTKGIRVSRKRIEEICLGA